MDTRQSTAGDACLLPSNSTPPDFDFNLPCRFFKSSFARSLSLNNACSSGSNNQCKSLDYDMRSNNSNNVNKLLCFKRDVTAVPPLPQRRLSQAGSFYQKNEGNITMEQKQVFADTTTAEIVFDEEEKPPALPARRPQSLHNVTLPQFLSVNECQMNAEQKFQQNVLTQLRQQVYKQATNSVMPVNGDIRKNYTDHDTGLQLSPQQHQPTLNQKSQPHHFTASGHKNAGNCGSTSTSTSCNSSSVNKTNSSNKINFRRNNNSNNNHIVWPNQKKNVEQYVCHMRTNIKYSPDKMWYIASFVRGMSVDEALKQLNFVLKKGAVDVKEVIQEAIEMAQKRHNVEYRSNLWIAESYVGKGRIFKGFRRHARGRFGQVEYKHCHYFVRLEEGEPPKNYYLPTPETPSDQFEKWLEQMRMRKIINSL